MSLLIIARVALSESYFIYTFHCSDTVGSAVHTCLLPHRRSPIPVLTTPYVDQPHWSRPMHYHKVKLPLPDFTTVNNLIVCCYAPLPSARQHLSYGDCLEVKREYYQNSSVLDCVTQCSQSAAHLCEHFLQVKQIGFVTLGPLCCA